MRPPPLLLATFLFPFWLHAQDPLVGDWVGDFYQSNDSYAYKISIDVEKNANGYTGKVTFEWADDQPHKIAIGENCGWDASTGTLTLSPKTVLSSDTHDSINNRLLRVQFSGKLKAAVNGYTLSGIWTHNDANLQKPVDYTDLANCKTGQFTCSRDLAVVDIAAAKISKDLAQWQSENPAASASDIENKRKNLSTQFFNTYFRMNGATLSYDSSTRICTITIDGCQSFPIPVAPNDIRRFTKEYNNLSLDRNLIVDWDSTKRIGIVRCFRFTAKKTNPHITNSWSYGTCN